MGKRSILIAEDDADDRMLLKTAFEESGFKGKLDFVENGTEVMQYLNTMLDNKTIYNQFPGFIMLDLNMPIKDGREVLKEIKEHTFFKRIPVLVFTTTTNENEIQKCYELGANSFFVKPDSYDILKKVIANIHNYWMQVASVVL